MILLDTNVLVASKQNSHADHVTVTSRLLEFHEDKRSLVICPQVLYEFYVVLTRPADKKGFGLSPEQAGKEVDDLIGNYDLVPETEKIFENWKSLVASHAVSGKNAHYTRLVAFMLTHGIRDIYTMNRKDFVRFNPTISLL